MDGMFCIIFVVIICLPSRVHSAQWSNSFREGATVDTCAGDVNATFLWSISLASGEEITDIQWFYHSISEELIAMYTHGHFVSLPAFSQRVQQKNVTGLVLNHVTEGDSGNYSVEVIVSNRSSGAASVLRHSAVLTVYSQSKAIADATVSVIEEPTAVWDNTTGQYHMTLSCLHHGRQPPAVKWTLPPGSSQVVWTSEGGKFSLLVPNPVSGGNYTCSVQSDTPAARCLPTNSPVLRGDTFYLDAVTARLTLIETEQQALKAENNQLKTENSQQASSIQALQTENSQQSSYIQSLHTEISQLQTENNQQSSSIQTLQTENSQQASSIQTLRTEISQQATAIRNLQAENQRLHDIARKRVAFHVSGAATIHHGNNLNLTNVEYNQGNGYSTSTGIFTAPYSGTYNFLATLRPAGISDRASVYLETDGGGSMDCDPPNTGESHACVIVVHLNAEQRAWLRSDGEGHFHGWGTAFSGLLVSPDP